MTEATTLPTCTMDGAVAVVTLDDGKANALSSDAVATLDGLLDEAESSGARALVVIGRPGRFSAGFDLAEMTASTESMRALVGRGARWLLRVYGLGLPTVAACSGHALAAGALTLLASDVRIGADVPAKIGLNEVAIGMALPAFAVELARDRLATEAFVAATLTGQVYDPASAVTAGYLDRIVPAENLLDAAMAQARDLTELRTGAFARTKANARGDAIARSLAGLDGDLATVEAPPA